MEAIKRPKQKTEKELAREKIKAKLKEKTFNAMSRAEKDELLYELLIIHGLVKDAN